MGHRVPRKRAAPCNPQLAGGGESPFNAGARMDDERRGFGLMPLCQIIFLVPLVDRPRLAQHGSVGGQSLLQPCRRQLLGGDAARGGRVPDAGQGEDDVLFVARPVVGRVPLRDGVEQRAPQVLTGHGLENLIGLRPHDEKMQSDSISRLYMFGIRSETMRPSCVGRDGPSWMRFPQKRVNILCDAGRKVAS